MTPENLFSNKRERTELSFRDIFHGFRVFDFFKKLYQLTLLFGMPHHSYQLMNVFDLSFVILLFFEQFSQL